ncbi:MAG TPA: hypothetical protein VM889_12930 [Candidatus Thermoplasmatota archaeon]|nr:hypothetical protein [Candidatus Thermoplasmatota archaeon]
MRRITVSCPGCHTEYKQVRVDEAENLLFHGCVTCRGRRQTYTFRGGQVGRAGEDA